MEKQTRNTRGKSQVQSSETRRLEDIPAEERRARRKEVGDVIKQRLAAPVRDGYKRRWSNDDQKGNIEHRLQMGYNFVMEELSDGRKQKVRQRVGTQESGEPMYAYLMEIPEDWYVEDQRDKQKEVDELDAALMGGDYRGRAGEASSEGMYVPKTGIKIERR